MKTREEMFGANRKHKLSIIEHFLGKDRMPQTSDKGKSLFILLFNRQYYSVVCKAREYHDSEDVEKGFEKTGEAQNFLLCHWFILHTRLRAITWGGGVTLNV